jgi:hypothetical protein
MKEDQPMPDVSSIATAEVRLWVVFDVHKNSLVAGGAASLGWHA